MLIDINTYIGHWPFRRLRDNTAAELCRRLDAERIDRAVVGSIHAALYKNPHAANEELARQTRRHRDRLLPFATLDPTYPGWKEDLRRCAETLGLAGLRLYPQYHAYSLRDPRALELVDAAAGLGWCVQVPMRLVDRRQRHRWDLADDLTAGDLEGALELRPQVKWMFLDAAGLRGEAMAAGRFVVDISRMTAVLQRTIQSFAAGAGSARLAFGTGMPFKSAAPARLKLEVLDLGAADRDRIAWRNAAQLLDSP
jgi:uncharacterized protein